MDEERLEKAHRLHRNIEFIKDRIIFFDSFKDMYIKEENMTSVAFRCGIRDEQDFYKDVLPEREFMILLDKIISDLAKQKEELEKEFKEL